MPNERNLMLEREREEAKTYLITPQNSFTIPINFPKNIQRKKPN